MEKLYKSKGGKGYILLHINSFAREMRRAKGRWKVAVTSLLYPNLMVNYWYIVYLVFFFLFLFLLLQTWQKVMKRPFSHQPTGNTVSSFVELSSPQTSVEWTSPWIWVQQVVKANIHIHADLGEGRTTEEMTAQHAVHGEAVPGVWWRTSRDTALFRSRKNGNHAGQGG